MCEWASILESGTEEEGGHKMTDITKKLCSLLGKMAFALEEIELAEAVFKKTLCESIDGVKVRSFNVLRAFNERDNELKKRDWIEALMTEIRSQIKMMKTDERTKTKLAEEIDNKRTHIEAIAKPRNSTFNRDAHDDADGKCKNG